ncbi:MAG: hypothetical protein ABWZ87_09350 [Aeromicrobium sp.]
MFEPPGSPEYPPRHDTWQFPPPPVPTRWKWVAVLAGLLGLVASGAMLTFVIVVGNEDFPGVIDDEKLTDTVAETCRLMTRTVASMPPVGTPEGRAATVADQNRAVEQMVRSIRSQRAAEIRDDRPAELWLRDWDRLIEARNDYARALLRDPNASLELPVDADGHDITERMDDVWVGDSACRVPEALTTSGSGNRSDV